MQHLLHKHFKRPGLCLCLCLFLLLAGSTAWAQQTISGQVTSAEDRQPVPGATIKVKGANRGALTDAQGQFSIAATATDTLQVSYMGFTPAAIAVKGQQNILIT